MLVSKMKQMMQQVKEERRNCFLSSHTALKVLGGRTRAKQKKITSAAARRLTEQTRIGSGIGKR
jgi:hypothetical protein